MSLTGPQFQQLQQALLSAFPSHSVLAQMVRIRLNENLDAIAGTGRLSDVAYNLITWAEAQGRMEELVGKAREANLGNSDLKAFAQAFLDKNNNLSASSLTVENLGARTSPSDIASSHIDFVILTALEVERRAVCSAFGLTDQQRVKKGSRVYWKGRLPLPDGEAYEIVVVQLSEMANTNAALATSDALHHWNPGSALMVGIAAAANKEQSLGDVAVGNHVYYYERGKVKSEGVKPEPYMYAADATLWNNVITLPDWTEPIPASRPDGTEVRPKVHQGVIASGEKVIADEAVRDQIASGHRKIIAIEMEGYGFSTAVWQSFQQVRHLVIRGICDLADASKNDEWHPYAAAAAASFSKHFILDRPLEPRNITANPP